MQSRSAPDERIDLQDETLGEDLLKAQQNLIGALGWIGLKELQGGRYFVNRAIASIGMVNLTTPDPFGLSPREQEVVGLTAIGLHNSQIAAQLSVAESTVTRQLTSAYKKMGVTKRTQAGRVAHEHGLYATAGVVDTSYILRLFTKYNHNGPLAWNWRGAKRELNRQQQIASALIVVAHELLLPPNYSANNGQITP